MSKLRPDDLYSLEEYHKVRPDFRARVLAHKRNRQVAVGPNATLYFEDRLTMQYQIQEMLRIERIFEAEAIDEELGAYNPLIPDGTNLKATFMVEFPDPEERRIELAKLKGIENRVWLQVEGHGRSFGVADEDLDRANDDKTSAVHFVRFEVDAAARQALAAGAALMAGIDHQDYCHQIEVPAETRDSLRSDFDA